MTRETIYAVASYRGIQPHVLAALAEVAAEPGAGRMGLRAEGERVRGASTAEEADFQALDQAARELAAHVGRVRELAAHLEDDEVLLVALAAYDCGDVVEAVRAHAKGRAPKGARAGHVARIEARAAALARGE